MPRGQRSSARQTTAEVVTGSGVAEVKIAANAGGMTSGERDSFPGLSIPKTFDPGVSIAPPHESTVDPQIEFNFNRSAASQSGFTLGGPDKWETSAKEETFAKGEVAAAERPSSMASPREQSYRSERLGDSSRWRGMIWVGGPVLVAITACLFISYLVAAYPSVGKTFFSGAFSAAPRVSPPGLMIEKTEFQKVVLESGDTVYTVSGTIANRTKGLAKEILVEAILFDAHGGVVAREVVSSGSTLARTRIKSLSEEMIRNLQSGSAVSKRSELKPDQTQDFLIAILDSEAARAQYYSARVFSVGAE